MANGVVCPHCKSELEGKVKRGEIVDCPECGRRFNITAIDLERYKNLQTKLVSVKASSGKSTIPKKKMPMWAILLITFFGLGLLGNIVGGTRNNVSTDTSNTNKAAPVPEREPVKKIEETKDDDSEYFSSWDGSNRELVSYVKQNMKDPDSFEHVETRFRDNGSSYDIIMKYRGKNSFNATTTEQVTAHFDKITRNLTEVQAVK